MLPAGRLVIFAGVAGELGDSRSITDLVLVISRLIEAVSSFSSVNTRTRASWDAMIVCCSPSGLACSVSARPEFDFCFKNGIFAFTWLPFVYFLF